MQTGLACCELIARIHQIPMDMRQVVRNFALGNDELTPEMLLRILNANDFKAKLKTLPLEKLSSYPFPMILVKASGEFVPLLKLDAEQQKVLVFDFENSKTEVMELTDITDGESASVIVLKHKALNQQVKFGFLWFYKEILNYKRVLMEVLLGSFMVQLFGLIIPLFTQVILDKVLVHQSITTLNVLGIAFVALMVFELLLNLARNYIFSHTANKIDAKLGARLFKHLFALPFGYFETRQVGNIVARVRELDTIREFLTQKSVSLIIDLIFSVVFLLMMLIYSVKLTMIALGFILAIGILYVFITPGLRSRLEEKFQMGAKSNAYLVESTTGIQTVKSLAIEGSMQKNWENHLGNYVKSGFELAKLNHVGSALATFLQKGMTIAILFMGVQAVLAQELSVGQLIAFQMFSGQLIGPILRLLGLWNEFQQTLLAVDRLADILNHPTEVQNKQAITLPKLDGKVAFDNLTFRYSPESPDVLQNVSFTVEPGQSIGIVGRSGSGKSTITKLIQRLYMPQQGAIFIDGIDLRQLNISWFRHHIGVVLQENYLFSGSVRSNIAMPTPDAPIEQIIQAAQIAGAHEFITQLPQGYDTDVGERGGNLSGGQKQRVAIARALMTNPKILIFDEATSALDAESEQLINSNLDRIKQGRTLFIITHKLANVAKCDQVLVMDQGKLVEQGTHQSLLLDKGLYAQLVRHTEVLS